MTVKKKKKNYVLYEINPDVLYPHVIVMTYSVSYFHLLFSRDIDIFGHIICPKKGRSLTPLYVCWHVLAITDVSMGRAFSCLLLPGKHLTN